MSRQENDNIIVSRFDGLDTTTTPNDTPLSSAVVLKNVLPITGGALEKRPGTRVQYRDSYGRYGVSLESVTTSRGYTFLVSKEGQALRVYLTTSSGLQVVSTKANVFSAAALRTPANIIVLNDVPTRALFFTGVNKPVQLQFTELITQGVGGTSVVFDEAASLNGIGAGNSVLFRNGSLVTGTLSYNYNATTRQLTIGGISPTITTSDTFELVSFTWQWWAEALRWQGDRFYNTAPRLHLAATTDVNVAIPASLRTDMPVRSTVDARYPIIAYPNVTAFNAPHTYMTGKNPTTSTEYSFSDGSPYTPGTSERLTPTPFFVTFGSVIASSQATTTHFFRRREAAFNGIRKDIRGDNLRVFVNGVPRGQSISATASGGYADYYGYATEFGAFANAASTVIKYVSFEASSVMGVGALSVVELVNVERTHIGSAATQTRWVLQGSNLDGSYIPIYGIGRFADYYRGYYPRVAALFKGRLALGGMRNIPQRVIVSATFDSRSELPYSFFQISDDNVLDTDPIDVNIPATNDENITGLMSWEESNFVFTNKGVYRISSGDSAALSPKGVQTLVLSRVGAINQRCIAKTETGVFYLSQNGVYNLTARANVKEDFNVEASSNKIEKVWDVLKTRTNTRPWICYDNITRLLYVGLPLENLPDDYTYKVYVYSLQQNAWTEYYTHGYFRIYHMVFHLNLPVFAASTKNSVTQQPSNFVLGYFGDTTYYLDFVDVAISTGTTAGFYSTAPFAAVRHTTSAAIQEYATTGDKTGQINGFELTPFTSVRDCRVFLNGVELTFGADIDEGAGFIKLHNGNIYLLSPPPDGDTLDIYPRMWL